MNNPPEEVRDLWARLYRPELQYRLNKVEKDSVEAFAKALLGTETPEKCLRSRFDKTPEEDPEEYIRDKQREYMAVNYRYARIFELCRVIGVKHIFDIGCQGLNQSFLLGEFSTMTYTGIDTTFSLNDWRERDAEDGNYFLPINRESAPPPLFNGRIRFVKGWYPEAAPDVPPESIAVGCYSLTMTRPEDIPDLAKALHRDFDRMLFNVFHRRENVMDAWRTAAQAWTGFTIRPIGDCGFVYASRHPDDFERLSRVYPVDELGRICTGIDNGAAFLIVQPTDSYVSWADWFRDAE